MTEFDLTPDPKVLIALTHTPLQPLDALCELIDNAIDSFHVAKLQGAAIEFPLVVVELPGVAEIGRGEGLVRVRDNGPGLTAGLAEKALRAGYSGNRPYDSLGLFGMGFNISSGKLGRVTRFLTARKGESDAIEVVVDLIALQERHNYKVPVNVVKKPQEFDHGTIVEVHGWWPEGNPNNGFIRKLVSYGKAEIRRQISRRYATILREDKIRILVNGDACEPFEHCTWDSSRSLERKGIGQIPAVFKFNEVVGNQSRCSACNALIPSGENSCPTCGSGSFRTLEERIRGWVGIQRFDDANEFGIDLIRNGRAIRIAEKSAFFDFTDELKKVIKDYPIDSPYGRIVGEVHLNHVPVDFLKQDFQRSSPEWQRAISFLRGESSLQPTQPGAENNRSPVFKLYQGYRKVRTPGRTDMYMGYWDADSGKPKRVSRETEKEYYEKFSAKQPGYHDDSEWWKLVDQADQPPVPELVECPECKAQNLRDDEQCQVCGHVLIGKACLNPECTKIIAKSAVTCGHCGTSQVPEIEEPWKCEVCGEGNAAEAETCRRCNKPRGTGHPASIAYLMQNADKDDELSMPGCSVLLADGTYSPPIDVITYVTRVPIETSWQGPHVPVLAFKGEQIEVFVDKSHPLFRTYRMRPEPMISTEIAQFLYENNRRLLSPRNSGVHSISNLCWLILEGRWAEELEDSADDVKADIRYLFDAIRGRLAALMHDKVEDLFDDLTEIQKKSMVARMLGRNLDIGNLGEMKKTGEYLVYVDEDTVVEIFRKLPAVFFDGGVWDIAYVGITDLPEPVLREVQSRIVAKHLNCLEDCAGFLSYDTPENLISQRARASVDFLLQRLE
jgi:RNA polymerase subunit RPABC4/transcription elongation factor Spt4